MLIIRSNNYQHRHQEHSSNKHHKHKQNDDDKRLVNILTKIASGADDTNTRTIIRKNE